MRKWSRPVRLLQCLGEVGREVTGRAERIVREEMFGAKLHRSAQGIPVAELNRKKQAMLKEVVVVTRELALKTVAASSSTSSTKGSSRDLACVETSASMALSAIALPVEDDYDALMARWIKKALSHARAASMAKDVDEELKTLMAAGLACLVRSYAAHGKRADAAIEAWSRACVWGGVTYPARRKEAARLGATISRARDEDTVEAVALVARYAKALPRSRSTTAEQLASIAVSAFVVDCARRERASTAEVADAAFEYIKGDRSVLVIGYAANQLEKALEFASAPAVSAKAGEEEHGTRNENLEGKATRRKALLSDEARTVLLKSSLEHCVSAVRQHDDDPYEIASRALELTEIPGEQPTEKPRWRGVRFENEGMFELRARAYALLGNLDKCLDIFENELPGRVAPAASKIIVDSRFAKCFYSDGKSPVDFYTKLLEITAKLYVDDLKPRRRRNRDFLYADVVTEILRSVSFLTSLGGQDGSSRDDGESLHLDLITWGIKIAKQASAGFLDQKKLSDSYSFLNIHGCNAILEALVKCERTQEAMNWFEAMRKGNSFQKRPKESTYNVWIKYHISKSSHADEVESVLTMMTNDGIIPMHSTVDLLVEFHTKAGDHQAAVTAVQDVFNMHAARPSPQVFVELLVELLASGDHDEARRATHVLDQLWPVNPDTRTRPHNMLSEGELVHLFESYDADLNGYLQWKLPLQG